MDCLVRFEWCGSYSIGVCHNMRLNFLPVTLRLKYNHSHAGHRELRKRLGGIWRKVKTQAQTLVPVTPLIRCTITHTKYELSVSISATYVRIRSLDCRPVRARWLQNACAPKISPLNHRAQNIHLVIFVARGDNRISVCRLLMKWTWWVYCSHTIIQNHMSVSKFSIWLHDIDCVYETQGLSEKYRTPQSRMDRQ